MQDQRTSALLNGFHFDDSWYSAPLEAFDRLAEAGEIRLPGDDRLEPAFGGGRAAYVPLKDILPHRLETEFVIAADVLGKLSDYENVPVSKCGTAG